MAGLLVLLFGMRVADSARECSDSSRRCNVEFCDDAFLRSRCPRTCGVCSAVYSPSSGGHADIPYVSHRGIESDAILPLRDSSDRELLRQAIMHVDCYLSTPEGAAATCPPLFDPGNASCAWRGGGTSHLAAAGRCVPIEDVPFSADPFLIHLLRLLLPTASAYVETGTSAGVSLQFVCTNFGGMVLHSCEIMEAKHKIARARLDGCASIGELALEGTQTFLPRVVGKLVDANENRPFFFIDAHHPDLADPLDGELVLIASKFGGRDAFVLVHDFEDPVEPFSRGNDLHINMRALAPLLRLQDHGDVCLFFPSYRVSSAPGDGTTVRPAALTCELERANPTLRGDCARMLGGAQGFALVGIGRACEFAAPPYLRRVDAQQPLTVLYETSERIYPDANQPSSGVQPRIWVLLGKEAFDRASRRVHLSAHFHATSAIETSLNESVPVQNLVFSESTLAQTIAAALHNSPLEHDGSALVQLAGQVTLRMSTTVGGEVTHVERFKWVLRIDSSWMRRYLRQL